MHKIGVYACSYALWPKQFKAHLDQSRQTKGNRTNKTGHVTYLTTSAIWKCVIFTEFCCFCFGFFLQIVQKNNSVTCLNHY